MVVSTLESSKVGKHGDPPQNPGAEEISEGRKEFRNEIVILVSAPLLKENEQPVANLSIQKEIDEIVATLRKIRRPIRVEIIVKVATTETLLEVFSNQFKPLIIHFIGHGAILREGTALVLEDKVGKARPFSEEDLATALGSRKEAPCQLALLNACHSEGLAEALRKAGVSHVIAVNAEDTILDLAARCFAKHLYQALFNENTVLDGFLQSRNAVKLSDELKQVVNPQTFERGVNVEEALKFRLLQGASQHNDGLKLQSVNSGQIIAPRWEQTNLASDEPTFVGRRGDLHRVIKILTSSDYRCVALHGMGGMGKTALAYAIGRWYKERDRFRDGVWKVELRDAESVDLAKIRIKQVLQLNNQTLAQSLKDRNLLLILDDLDKLIDKQYEQLIELLNNLLNCRELKLLVTSRQDIPEEVAHRRLEICEMGES